MVQVTASIQISKPLALVWSTITDIENSASMISSIIDIEVLNKPSSGFKGFKWKETRKMFGKEATETMWVTDSVENEYYTTRAESHGSIYTARLSLTPSGTDTILTMSFQTEAQTFFAKLMSALMSPMIKGSLEKEIKKDLSDIKQHLQQGKS